jgi:hypothetical protein
MLTAQFTGTISHTFTGTYCGLCFYDFKTTKQGADTTNDEHQSANKRATHEKTFESNHKRTFNSVRLKAPLNASLYLSVMDYLAKGVTLQGTLHSFGSVICSTSR